MKQKLTTLVLALLAGISAWAHDFEVDGIYYEISWSNDLMVSVTYKSDDYGAPSIEYSGAIVIPESVTYNGKTYSVTSIGYAAFEGSKDLTSVTIPNSVKTISYAAFSDCSGLTFVTIPSSVTLIDMYAFASCSGLTSITIPSKVEAINHYAFAWCSDLKTVYFNADNCTSMGDDISELYPVFSGCTSLTEIVIGDNVKTVPSNAFYGCSSLTSVTIGSGVTYIGDDAFAGCNFTKENFVNKSRCVSNTNWGACIYEETADGLKIDNRNVILGCREDATSVVIPMSVIEISGDAFKNCTSLKNLTIEDGRETLSLGNNQDLFSDCPLESVYIGRSISHPSGSPFSYSSKITELTIGEQVTSIGDYAFSGCSGLMSIEIPSSVTSIGDRAFSGCSGLTSVTFNAEYCSSGSYVFTGCSSLTEINIGDKVTTIPSCAFYGCSGLTSIEIPSSVTSIGTSAFPGCSGLTSVKIPSSVTEIDSDAFKDCTSIKKLTIEDSSKTLSLGYNTRIFYNCPLESVYLGRCISYYSYESGEKSPFYNKSGITELIIGEQVTSIGAYMFSGCSGLTSVEIPSGVTSIGVRAFSNCSGLTSVTFNAAYCSSGSYVFTGCSSLTEINIGDKVNTIPSSAFSGCMVSKINFMGTIEDWCYKKWTPTSISSSYELFFNGEKASSITIPSSVTHISTSAFSGCNGLTSVEIPSGVTSIGVSAFSNCSGLTRLNFNAENCFSMGSSSSPVFPNCSSLTEINIGDNVTIIPSYAFSGCTSVKKLTIEDGAETLTLGNAFYDCPLENVYLGRNIIGDSPFYNKSTITKLTIGEQVTSIGDRAFSGCSGLTSVVIPSSVTSIGTSAFYGCSGLTSVEISSNVTLIGASAFSGCSGLTSVEIPSSVTTIGTSAFSGCSGLTSVVIPSSVTSIGDEAFINVTKAFFLNNTKPTIGKDAFSSCKVYYTANESSYGIPGEQKVYSLLSSIFEVDGAKYIPTSMSQRTCDMVDVKAVNTAISPTVKYTNSSGRQYDFKVNKINMYAGYECKELSDLIFKNEGEIEAYAFYKSKASTIDVGNTVTTIGEYAFSGCASATNIKISNNGAIGSNAFKDCMKTNDGEIEISNEGNIGNYAFSGCTSAISITVSNNGDIGYGAFSGCASATNIKVSNNGAVGSNAFKDCMKTNDGEIEISNEGNIGNYAFSGCTAAKLIIASNYGDIGEYAFSDCTAATNIKVSNSGAVGSNAFKDCMKTSDGVINITNQGSISSNAFYNCAKATKIDIDNKGSIGANAFYGCIGAKEIILGNAITSIGNNSFENCASVERVKFGKYIYTVGSRAFYNCSSITSVEFNKNLQKIDSYAFGGCRKITTLSIPASVTSIASNAFEGSISDLTLEDSEKAINLACYFPNVKNIYMGRNVTYSMSKSSPFSGNNTLEKVSTSIDVTSLPDYAFYNCKGLKDVFLSDGIKTIGAYAFSGDIALKTFEVGMDIESIGAEAFSDCTALLDFTSHSKLPAIVGTEALDDIDKLECTLHVPEGTKEAYMAADQWKEFWIEGDCSSTRYKVIAKNEYSYGGIVKGSNGYDENTIAILEAVPDEWYRFVEWSDGDKTNPRTITVTEPLNLTAKFEYRYSIKTQPTADNISVELSEEIPDVQYKWYVSDPSSMDITNDLQSPGTYRWTQSGGVWKSGNKGIDKSSSTMNIRIKANAGEKLSFDYSVSSESGYDYLEVYLDTYQICKFSGEQSGTYDYTFWSDRNANLKFVYSKDDLDYDGSDQATISNVVIKSDNTLLDDEISNSVSISSLDNDKYYYCRIVMPDGTVLTSDRVQYEGGQPTAIEQIGVDDKRGREGIYDIMGRKLSVPQRGINIINGKKVIVR